MDFETTDTGAKAGESGRGLRGIAIDGETIYFTASDALLAFTPEWELIGSWRCPYLNNAREMCVYERNLYIASTGFDSILAFDLDKQAFHWAMQVDVERFNYSGFVYDPMGEKGPLLLNKMDLNSVHANDNGMYISGRKSGGMLLFNGEKVHMSATLPNGTHNAKPFRDGVLFNDSEAEAVRYASRSGEEDRAIKTPQGAGRGLCLINDRIVAAGSSPATIALHDLLESKTLLSAALSEDDRSSIHSLAVWPF